VRIGYKWEEIKLYIIHLWGELIKMKREETGMSLSELGRLSGVHKSALARIENGEFDLSIEQLLQGISYYAMIGSYKDIIECSNRDFLLSCIL